VVLVPPCVLFEGYAVYWKHATVLPTLLITAALAVLPAASDTAPGLSWAARYAGSGASLDEARALAVDVDGNVYVTGISGTGRSADFATVKFNCNGERLWASRYGAHSNSEDGGAALAVDREGSIYVAGYSSIGNNNDYLLLKYSAAGSRLWAARYNQPGNTDIWSAPVSLEVDGSGNAYLAGLTRSGNDYDYLTVKFGRDGQQLWAARYDGPGDDQNRSSSRDEARALAVDSAGNVYVTGLSQGSGGFDYATVKYSSSGGQAWARRYAGPRGGYDEARSVKLDPSGNVYVTGSSSNGADLDYATVKYDDAGIQLWVARYDGPDSLDDSAVSLSVAPDGAACVTGSSRDSSTAEDFATVKYDPAGTQLWEARYDGGGPDRADALALDLAGNVHVAGYSFRGSAFDYAIVKYGSDGEERWATRLFSGAPASDHPAALAVDPRGSVYLGGRVWAAGAGFDYLAAAFKNQPPSAVPGALAARAVSPSRIDLSWTDASENEEGFEIERQRQDGSFEPRAQVGRNATAYSDTGLAAMRTYVYRVRAVNLAGSSAYTAPASATTPPSIPAAPSHLATQLLFDRKVRLTWRDNSGPNADPEDGFLIQRAVGTGTFVDLAAVGAGVASYLDAGLEPDTAYAYRVRAFNVTGDSPYSGPALIRTAIPPAAPINLQAWAVLPIQVRLTWQDASAGERGFRLERRTSSGAFTEIWVGPANAAAFTDNGVAAGTSYTYRVRAYDDRDYSDYSNDASVTTPPMPPPPAAPSQLTAQMVLWARVSLTWRDNSSSEEGFKIERRSRAGYTQQRGGLQDRAPEPRRLH
jgi:uncharacterized delta-60 repeat protein